VANYTLLIDAALVTASQQVDSISHLERVALSVAVLLVGGLALALLVATASDIEVRRERLKWLREEEFSKRFVTAWSAKKKRVEPKVPAIMYVVVVVGTVVACWMIARAFVV